MVVSLSFQERIDARRNAYKKGVDSDDVRRKREEETVLLRKQKRETQLLKKRCATEEDNSENVPPPSNAFAGPVAMKETGVRALIERLRNEPHESLAIVTELRKRLSQFGNPPIKEAAEAAPLLVSLLKSNDDKLLLQSAWALTNIASGTSEETSTVLAAGAVPFFVQLLESPNTDIRSQVM